MRTAQVFHFSILMSLCGCSTNHQNLGARLEVVRPEQPVGPVGTFVGPATSSPVMKVHLEHDGTYAVEDMGPPEFWTMVEGHTPYPQRIKFLPQRGHWSWDSRSGQLTLMPETSASFRWDTQHFRYEENSPDRLAWGDYAFLARSQE